MLRVPISANVRVWEAEVSTSGAHGTVSGPFLAAIAALTASGPSLLRITYGAEAGVGAFPQSGKERWENNSDSRSGIAPWPALGGAQTGTGL